MLIKVIRALQAGETLKNPEKWEKGQNLTNACSAIIACVVAGLRMFYPDFPMTDEQLLAISGILASLLTIINSYLFAATSEKRGVKKG